MGQTGSRVIGKIASSFSFSGGLGDGPGGASDTMDSGRALIRQFGGIPLVYSRRGSMYFDEDGDLANEFYEEVLPKKRGGTRKMKRVRRNLVPQGDVEYQHPRLHVDFPIILYQG